MPKENGSFYGKAPRENFSRGLPTLDIQLPEKFGAKTEGKVGEMWVVEDLRIIVRTDRVSAYDSVIGSIPSKGAVLTGLSAYWLNETGDIVPNHFVALPHPYVMVVKDVPKENRLPIEVIFRDYIARTKSSTSIWKNHQDGKRTIYGFDWPESILPNQRIEDGTKLTPTTKSTKGDEMLTFREARDIVNNQYGKGTWEMVGLIGLEVFKRGSSVLLKNGIILADTKMEFGLDEEGNIILIDELFTPDSSRLWEAETYEEKFEKGIDPENYDKEIVRKALAEAGYTGQGPIPKLDSEVIDRMTSAYKHIYGKITGEELEQTSSDPQELQEEIQQSILKYFE